MTRPNDYPNTIVPAMRDASVLAVSYQDTQNPDYLRALCNVLEVATVQTRNQYERVMAGEPIGKYGGKRLEPPVRLAGSIELYEGCWLHIKLNTLLPHCRFQTPAYLADTITRLLDEYIKGHGPLHYYQKALLIIDEHSDIESRQVFDQDNKGWKAIPNALKGRVFPDDTQDSLDIALLSKVASKPVCHIYVLVHADAADFFALRSSGAL